MTYIPYGSHPRGFVPGWRCTSTTALPGANPTASVNLSSPDSTCVVVLCTGLVAAAAEFCLVAESCLSDLDIANGSGLSGMIVSSENTRLERSNSYRLSASDRNCSSFSPSLFRMSHTRALFLEILPMRAGSHVLEGLDSGHSN